MPDGDDSPGSSPDAGEAARPPRCATCGARIDPTAWHPVATADDEEFHLVLFCSVACREEWREKNGRREE